MDPKKVVADGYDLLYRTYENWSSARHDGLRRQYIDAVFDLGLATPADALDLGCGTGRHATGYLMERGLQVTGLDISAKSIEAATAALPGAQFVVGDMASVEFVTESFDLVTAFYSIIHVPMQEHTALLERIASWMRPGGFLVVSLGGSEHAGSGVDESWLGEAPMFWSGWDAATNRRLVAGTGLEVITNQIEALDEDGRAVRFLWIVARKPTTS